MSIAEKFEKITDAVYDKGKKDFEASFVKHFTNNGTRTYYSYAFRTASFNADNVIDFKGMCKPTDVSQMFYNQKGTHLPMGINLSNINVSTVGVVDNLFSYSSLLLEIPDYNMPVVQRLNNTYSYCYALRTIHGKVRVNADTTYSNTFREDTALQNIEIDGIIGQNGFNVKDCTKLSKTSLLSILTALSKEKSIASGKSVNFADNHLDVIQSDEDCLAQLSSASGAGWSIFFGTTQYEG